MTQKLFIGGCGVSFVVAETGPPFLAGVEGCMTGALRGVPYHAAAKESCSYCPHAYVQTFLTPDSTVVPTPGVATPMIVTPVAAPAAPGAPQELSDQEWLAYWSRPVQWPWAQPGAQPATQAVPQAPNPNPNPGPSPGPGSAPGLGWSPPPLIPPQTGRDPRDELSIKSVRQAMRAAGWTEQEPAAPTPPVPEPEPEPAPRVGIPDPRKAPPLKVLLAPFQIQAGPSAFGWSKISAFQKCLRLGFWQYVLCVGEEPAPERIHEGKVKLSALALGSLVHACTELYLKAGFDPAAGDTCLDPVKSCYPSLAAEAYRLFHRYLDSYLEEDRREWDVRAVELETRFYYPPRKCRGKKRSFCLSARHDSVYRRLGRGDRRLAPGEISQDMLKVHDLKTLARMSPEVVQAYSHEGQVLTNLLCFNHGVIVGPDGALNPEAKLGTADGAVITFIGKAKDPGITAARSPAYLIDAQLVEQFRDEIGDWYYVEVLDRLLHPDVLEPATWPRSFLCRDPMTNQICPYIGFCEGSASWHAAAHPEQGLKIEQLELPKTRGRGRPKKTPVVQGQDK